MKKYSIALAGTFDVENYGDLMFPVIFEKAMEKRKIKIELTLFSPVGCKSTQIDNLRKVYSFQDFNAINQEKHFDAIVIGGGALIHYKDFEIFMPNREKRERYYNINSWLPLIYLAAKENIKILFNLPQVPFEIPKEFKNLTKSVLEQVDYIAIRDDFSKKYIEEIYDEENEIPKIELYPDSVMIVDELLNREDMTLRRKKFLKPNEKYMVLHFQFADRMTEEQFDANKSIMKDAIKRGLNVVLLPIGRTHGDDVTMKKFNNKVGNKCILLNENLDVIDITAILAGCEYYVGYSFHGSVVALAYGKKAFSMNLSLKNQELFNYYKIGECLNSNVNELLRVINDKLSKENGNSYLKKKVSEAVNKHFDNIRNLIVENKNNKKNGEKILLEIMLVISSYEKTLGQLNVIHNLELDIKNKEKIIRQYTAENDILKRELKLVQDSNAFKVGKKITWLPHEIKEVLVKNKKV